MRHRARVMLLVSLAATLSVLGCGADEDRSGASDDAGRPLVIGFAYVGARDDHGYNEAAYEGSRAVARAFPDARLIQAEHVPEAPAAEQVFQRMIDRGASIVFATSFGHLEPALRVAARNPRVTFLHQGGLQTADNLGTFFSTIWQVQYAAGQAAGLTTKSDRLGFVAAFPIAQSLLSINAFELGARSVNPRARTRVLFTSSWCAPARQRRAALRLRRWGADVLTQHQDCTATVIRTAQQTGAKTTGYHFDARDLAPRAWITGAAWDWRRLFVRMVREIVAGRFAESPFADRYRGSVRDGTARLASFGSWVPDPVRRRVMTTYAQLRSGRLQPFAGPVRDQRGRVRIEGSQPSIGELEETDYLVEGVVGHLAGP